MPSPSNPQSWDRYSYVLNNPLRYTDPTGHFSCDETDQNGNCVNYERNLLRSISKNYSREEAVILRDMLTRGGDITYHAVDYIVSHDVHLFVEDYGNNTGAKWTFARNIIINSHGSDFSSLNGVRSSAYYQSIVGLIAHEAKHLEQKPIVASSVYGEFEGWKTEEQVKNEMFRTVPKFGSTRYVVFRTPLTHDPDILGWVWRAMVGEQNWDYMVWVLPLNPLGPGNILNIPAIFSGH